MVPATRDLAGAEIELIRCADRERRLRALLEPLRSRFRFIVIDSPPSLGLLTLNALVAADSVLIPLHCEYFALEGLADLVATLRRVRAALNPALDIEGVLLTMNDERTNLGQQVARDVREFFKEKVYRTVIPRNVRLAEAPSHGMPAMTYDAKSRGAEAYTALAREVSQSNHADEALEARQHAVSGASSMADRKPALGKGLSALIPDAPDALVDAARTRSTSTSICSSPTTISRAAQIDDERLDDLARSIRANGIIQPIVARRRARAGSADGAIRSSPGERRWRAAQTCRAAQGPRRRQRRRRRTKRSGASRWR